jgi:hypothetical protein
MHLKYIIIVHVYLVDLVHEKGVSCIHIILQNVLTYQIAIRYNVIAIVSQIFNLNDCFICYYYSAHQLNIQKLTFE